MQAWVEEVTSQFRFCSAQTRVDCSSITWPAKQLLSLAHASYLRGSIRPVRPLSHALQTTAAIDSHAHDRRSVMRESQAKGQSLDRSSRDTKTRATGRRASRLSQREGWSHASANARRRGARIRGGPGTITSALVDSDSTRPFSPRGSDPTPPQVTGKPFDAPFGDYLRDGRVLCELANTLQPGAIKKVNASSLAFKQMEARLRTQRGRRYTR